MRKLLVALSLVLAVGVAASFGQGGNPTCPTRPTADATNACASTSFVHNVVALISSGITQLTGDVTAGPGTGSQAATLVAAQPGAHTWAATQTMSVAPVFTDPAGTQSAIGVNLGAITNCSLAASVSSNALTVSLKTQSGSDPSSTSPCVISFRNASTPTGTYLSRSITAALSFSTGTSGSTFSSTNNVPFRLWVTAWDTGSGVVLGVSKQSSTTSVSPINEGYLQSSTACNACTNATTLATFYTTAAQANKPIRILGYMDWTSGLATAGTWASGPNLIKNFTYGDSKPGDIIQTTYNTSTTATTGNGTTLVVSPPSQSITLQSAVNLVRADGNGILQMNSTGVPSAQLYRASGGSSACTTAVGSVGYHNLGATNATQTPTSAIDAPGAAGQFTYVVCIKASNASNSVYCLQSITATCTIILQEIMGHAEDVYDNDNDPRLLNKVG